MSELLSIYNEQAQHPGAERLIGATGGESAAAPSVGLPLDLQCGLVDYLNPESKMGLTSQIDFMRRMWRHWGVVMPRLGRDRMDSLDDRLARAEKFCRVVPTVLGLPGPYPRIHNSVNEQSLSQDRLKFSIPGSRRAGGKLLRHNIKQVDTPKGTLTIAHRPITEEAGLILGKISWLRHLDKHREVVRSSTSLWTFPVMDVRVMPGVNTELNIEKEFQDADPAASPESIIIARMLARLNLPQASPGVLRESRPQVANRAIVMVNNDMPAVIAAVTVKTDIHLGIRLSLRPVSDEFQNAIGYKLPDHR